MSPRADWTDLLGRKPGGRVPRVRDYLKRRSAPAPAPAPAGGRESARQSWPKSFAARRGGWLVTWLLAALVVGSVYALVWSIDAGKLLPLEKIALVQAPEKVTDEQLRNSLAGNLHPSLIGVDTGGIRQSLEGLAWVDEARVRRAWPSAVELHIEERRALGVWNGEALLDQAGRVFTPAKASFPTDLPRLNGPQGSAPDVAKNFKKIGQLFEKHGMSLKVLNYSKRGSWTANSADGVEVALGREQPVHRVARFVAVVPGLMARRDERMKRVDLRYPNGFAVAWATGEKN